jgi:murein DD-endopeptidase MepM/ murein hydrolase activator NlpD
MRTKHVVITGLLLVGGVLTGASAQERGLFKNSPRILPKTTQNSPGDTRQSAGARASEEFFEPETTTLRFNSQFEPKRELNPVIAEDTSQIDQGEIDVVEVTDSMQVGDEWVKVADYYSIWDSQHIDPYNLDPLEFKEVVDIKLYDPPAERFWSAPLSVGKLTSNFGFRWGRWHTGADLDLETGDPIYAAFDGVVRVVAFNGGGYGRYVLLRHYNGLETLYGHMSKPLVESGQLVKAGDQIGLGGSTGRSSGPHLHFELRYEGNPFNPLNIYTFPENSLVSDHFLLTPSVYDYLRGGRSADFKPIFKRTVLYRVQSGETISSIASRHGLSPSELAKKNRLSANARVRPGQRLRIN